MKNFFPVWILNTPTTLLRPGAKISERESLLSELDKISNREKRIRLAYENEVDTLEEYKRNKERLQKDREDIFDATGKLRQE